MVGLLIGYLMSILWARRCAVVGGWLDVGFRARCLDLIRHGYDPGLEIRLGLETSIVKSLSPPNGVTYSFPAMF